MQFSNTGICQKIREATDIQTAQGYYFCRRQTRQRLNSSFQKNYVLQSYLQVEEMQWSPCMLCLHFRVTEVTMIWKPANISVETTLHAKVCLSKIKL